METNFVDILQQSQVGSLGILNICLRHYVNKLHVTNMFMLICNLRVNKWENPDIDQSANHETVPDELGNVTNCMRLFIIL